MLPGLLAALARQHPQIQIELVPGDALSNLLEREADIAVRMLRPTQGTLITYHIADWPLGFYARQRLLAAYGGPPALATLAQHRWVGMDHSPPKCWTAFALPAMPSTGGFLPCAVMPSLSTWPWCVLLWASAS